MDALQKAVARARDVNAIDTGKALVGPLGIEHIRYTETRVVPISPEKARACRLVAHVEDDPLARTFSTLAMQLLLKMRKNGFRSLGVVVPTAGTGGSLVTANLSIALAREPNHTVLAVDANLRAPALADVFGVQPEYGLVDHLASGVPVPRILFNPGVPRLVILPGRNGLEGATELLASRRMRETMSDFRKRYDSRLVLYDMPPLLDTADALALLPQLDCALLVVQEGRTSSKELEAAKRILHGTPMIGALVNHGRSRFGRR